MDKPKNKTDPQRTCIFETCSKNNNFIPNLTLPDLHPQIYYLNMYLEKISQI
jgi:hypothetical protein